MSTEAYVPELPPCDLHHLQRNTTVPAKYDGKTRQGRWAYMCEACFAVHGVGLGLGRGQRLIVGTRPAPDTGPAADDNRYLD